MTAFPFIRNLTLALSIVCAPLAAHAEGRLLSDMNGIAADPNGPGAELAPEAQTLIDQKINDRASAPSWVKRLQSTRLASYFGAKESGDSKLPVREVQKLAEDAAALAGYYEQDDAGGELKDVPQKTIKPFLRSLTWKNLFSRIRYGRLTEPAADWTVEELVVRSDMKFLARFRDRTKRTLHLITGKHLKGASKAALALAMGGSVVYLAWDYGGEYTTMTVIMSVVWAFRSGPLATLMNAMTAWFINPTVEFVQRECNRYTARFEIAINKFYDKWKPPLSDPEADAKANAAPKIANVQEDGTNYGGMSSENQRENWEKLLTDWVIVNKHASKLLRGTAGGGRSILLNSWADELLASQYVETMDSKLTSLSVEELQLLTPYQTGFIVKGEVAKKDALDAGFDRFRDLCARTWKEELSDQQLEELGGEIRKAQEDLRELGLSESVVRKLYDIQVKRAQTVTALGAGLALNEMKLISNAEMNRNLPEQARQTQRALHNGFGVQRFVENYGFKVRDMHHKMGFNNDGHLPSNASCQVILQKIAN